LKLCYPPGQARSRSNSVLNTFFRRKVKGSSGSPTTEKRETSTFTIEHIFQTFAQLPASNQRDPLSKYIVSAWSIDLAD